MLQTYQARVNGSQLIWIDQPAQPLAHEQVLIVVERTQSRQPGGKLSARQAFIQAEGILGKASKEEVDRQLSALRAEWDRPTNHQ
jgi:hypothetical protein